MTDERDRELGRALRALPTPPHRPGFFEDLDGLLEQQPGAAPGGRRARFPFPLGPVLAVAAALALVVASVAVLRAGDDDRRVQVATPPPTSAVESPGETPAPGGGSRAQQAAAVRTVQGQLVLGDDGGSTRYAFVLSADGSYRLEARSTRDPQLTVHDASRGVYRSRIEGGGFFEQAGLGAGPPDAYAFDVNLVLQLDLGWHVLGRALEGDPAVRAGEHDGRRVWRYEADFRPNGVAGGPDHVVAVVDQQSALPLEFTFTAEGQLLQRGLVEDLVVNGDVPQDALALPGGVTRRESAGYERMPLRQAAAAAGFQPLLPSVLPAGFEHRVTAVNRTPGPTGPEGSNPLDGSAVSTGYRRGLDAVFVSMRPAGGDPSRWDDPLRGEGQRVTTEKARLTAGAWAGAEVELVLDPQSLPHLWGVHDGHVVTIAGALSRAELLAAANSLAPPGP